MNLVTSKGRWKGENAMYDWKDHQERTKGSDTAELVVMVVILAVLLWAVLTGLE